MPSVRTIDDLEIVGRRVLVRADLNVPFKDGRITDSSRIEAVAPTIAELSKAGARVVVLSHMGRPNGQPLHEFSLKPLAKPLGDAVGRVLGHHVTVAFAPDCIGDTAENAIARLDDGDIILLENVRFHAGEEMPEFLPLQNHTRDPVPASCRSSLPGFCRNYDHNR